MKLMSVLKNKKLLLFLVILIFLFIGLYGISGRYARSLECVYNNNKSNVILDRNGELLFIKANKSDYYANYTDIVNKDFEKLLLEKEDKYFYYHPGVNIFSIIRGLYSHYVHGGKISSSTITQQLVKILLGNEFERGFKNKIKETLLALSLEAHTNKEEIITMYFNSIFLGNRVQGVDLASKMYFGNDFESISQEEAIQLLANISSPSTSNPFMARNKEKSEALAKTLGLGAIEFEDISLGEIKKRRASFSEYVRDEEGFELETMNLECDGECELFVDKQLTKNIRETLKTNLLELANSDVMNGAVVVLKVPENELLAIVGTPDSTIDAYGYKINMAIRPRPIGSTIKPFIYAKGFEADLRPYTIVDDREYKYTIGSGYAFYPKNYDYKYRGEVSLHYALSNSLNVPTVKVMEYVGLENFYDLLLDDLEFNPIQDLENYQFGIALGGLEMDLLNLVYYFSVFPNNGQLRELGIYKGKKNNFKTSSNFNQNKKIFESEHVQLTNKILNDRVTGIEQFGIKSNLNLLQDNYAVKTGTSREYHDSWTIGYTPDFVVGVWLGNSNDTAMDRISGQSGAGKVWSEVMNLLFNSEYNKKTDFDFSLVEEYFTDNNIEYGLVGDDYEAYRDLLSDDKIILNPHNGDTFLLEQDTVIPFRSKQNMKWYVDEKLVGEGREYLFSPLKTGRVMIKGVSDDLVEELSIIIEEDN